MKKDSILNIVIAIENLFSYLYSQSSKHYTVNVNYYNNVTNISIKEQYENKKIFDLNIDGNMDIYNFIVKKINKMVINNDNCHGFLTTRNSGGDRCIEGQFIRTNNIEINLPIYNDTGLINAEAFNNEMYDKLNKNSIPKVKVKKIVK